MRSALALPVPLTLLVALATPARAQDEPAPPGDAPPAPEEDAREDDALEEDAPEEDEEPEEDDEPAGDDDVPVPVPVPVPDDEDGLEDDDDDERDDGDTLRLPRRLPRPDAKSGVGAAPFWGSAVSCALAGCVPAIGTAIGASSLTSVASGALGPESSVVAGGGLLVGVPSALALGPCASGGALAGGALGALLDDKEVAPVAVGAAPGVALGALSSVGAGWGLIVLASSRDRETGAFAGNVTLPATILGVSVLAALAAGPATVAGITLADALDESSAEPVGALAF